LQDLLVAVIAMIALTAALFVANLIWGSVSIPLQYLLHPMGIYSTILFVLRLPQAYGAVIVGIDLAVAGAVMQAVFRNPLADPYITGTASGAVLGSLAGIAFAAMVPGVFFLATLLQPAMGFAGALLATLLVVLTGRKGGWLALILAGIAVSIFLSSLATITDSWLLANGTASFSIFFLLFGSLGSLNASSDIIITLASVPVLLFIFWSGKKFNLMAIGDEVANSSGVDASRLRSIMITASSVLTALALSFTGIIGFVGLISPHITRLAIKDADNSKVLTLCGLVGAAILLLANLLSKIIIPYTVVPITAITSLIGAPALIYLIRRGRWIGQ
jgi:iron complex transport system permease protein